MSQFIEMFGNPLSSIQKNELKKLGDCCQINPRRPSVSISDSDLVSFVPMPAVNEDGYIDGATNEEYGKVKKGFTYFENNDVLFAKITPCMENGKGAIAEALTNGIGMGSTEFHVLRPIEGISNPYWLLTLTRMPIFRECAAKNMSGTGGQRRVRAAFLENFMIGLPSISEQETFETIYRQADKSEFVGCKSQFIEMFYGGKYTVDKLRKHIDVIRGVSYKPSDVYETHNENTSIVLRSNNIECGQINFDDLVYVSTDRVSEFQLLSAGDIVMCGSNGSKKLVGKAAMLQSTPIAHTSFGAFCLGIRCKPTLVPEYLATYFQTSLYRDKIEQLGSGSNILNIKPDHIYNLEIPIPLYDEQMAFVTIVKQADKSEYYN